MGKPKRKSSGGGDGDRQPKRLSSGGSQKEADVLPMVAEAFVLNPFLNQVLKVFDDLWQNHEDVYEILASILSTRELKEQWARKMDEWFPPDPQLLADGKYLKKGWSNATPDDDVVNLRPWQWSFDREAGNKGCVSKDAFRSLLSSMLASGFRTDILDVGTELPVVTATRPELASNDPESSDIYIDETLAPAFSVHEVKGWSRVLAMNIGMMCVDLAKVTDQYLDFVKADERRFQAYQCQVANYISMNDGKDEVDLNRGRAELY